MVARTLFPNLTAGRRDPERRGSIIPAMLVTWAGFTVLYAYDRLSIEHERVFLTFGGVVDTAGATADIAAFIAITGLLAGGGIVLERSAIMRQVADRFARIEPRASAHGGEINLDTEVVDATGRLDRLKAARDAREAREASEAQRRITAISDPQPALLDEDGPWAVWQAKGAPLRIVAAAETARAAQHHAASKAS